MSKTIFISLAPNTEIDDVFLSLSLIFRPWQWHKGRAIRRLEEEFKKWLPAKYAFAFSSGRGALYAILSSLGIGAGDEVLIQAYTCLAVPAPIKWLGARSVYVDIEENSFIMSPDDLERKITPQSRAVIIQHSFGQAAPLEQLLEIARRNNLVVIEDCAHALGAKYQGQKLGTWGDFTLFSFGRDKVISSVFGGMVTSNQKQIQDKLALPSRAWILQQLLHPGVIFFSKLLYDFFWLGKIKLAGVKYLGIISRAVTKQEKKGIMPKSLMGKMPNALAFLALKQFQKLERFNRHRQKIAALYHQELKNTHYLLPQENNQSIYLRYTIQTNKAEEIRRAAKKKKIFLGDWYNCPIAPCGLDYQVIDYQLGSCPVAEKLAKKSLNLPTDIHISKKDALRIVRFLKSIEI